MIDPRSPRSQIHYLIGPPGAMNQFPSHDGGPCRGWIPAWGRVWLIVGTDSGFEGLTALYYSRISYTLSTVELPATGDYSPPVWAVVLAAGIGAALVAGGAGLVVDSRRLSRRVEGR